MCSVKKTKGGATTCKLEVQLCGRGGRTSNLSGARLTRSDVVVVPIALLAGNFEANRRVPCRCVSDRAHCFFAPLMLQNTAEKVQDP